MGGPGGNRTPYLLVANEAFNQVNFRPRLIANHPRPAKPALAVHIEIQLLNRIGKTNLAVIRPEVLTIGIPTRQDLLIHPVR